MTPLKKKPFNIKHKIAVVIPCYRVKKYILEVIKAIGPEVNKIYIVDDYCPLKTGEFASRNCHDKRVNVIYHDTNLGVGASTISGYKKAMEDNMDIIVKLDGDGQMNPALIPNFVIPIIHNEADYTKGNRFYSLEKIRTMPTVRIIGNASLSFLNKISSGYWDLFDPTNGYTAVHSNILKELPLFKISQRYFFESDMLFRLNTLRAVVLDIPMNAVYEDEKSNLNIRTAFFEFLFNHIKNLFKRIFYNYFLRDMSIASFEIILGFILVAFGLFFGGWHWLHSFHEKIQTPLGTIMLSSISIIIGIQFLLSFLAYDIYSVPKRPIHTKIGRGI